jgi:hypothetical protein
VRWDGAAFALGAALATVNGVAAQAHAARGRGLRHRLHAGLDLGAPTRPTG